MHPARTNRPAGSPGAARGNTREEWGSQDRDPIDTHMAPGVQMRVMRLMSPATTRPASVAAALGLLLTTAALPASAVPQPRSGHKAPAYFYTLPPGAKLPSGAQCARWVRARPIKENKGVNRRYNHTTAFKRDEQKFAYYEEAERWIERNVRKLRREARRK